MRISKLTLVVLQVVALGSMSVAGNVTYAAEQALVLEEIIVTATKRDVNLQDASIAVTSLDARQFDQLNIRYPVDLSGQVPGLNIAKNESRRIITIRSIGNEANQNAGSRPGIAYHIDGVFISTDRALRADMLDVERVEVVRGPQGTIFGQNATGGTINVISKKPDLTEASGYGEVILGDYDMYANKFGFNLPLSETLAARVSVSHREHEGYTYNRFNGEYLDDENIDSARAQLLWQPSDSFSALLAYQWFDSDANGPAQKGTRDTLSSDIREVSQDKASSSTVGGDILSGTFTWDFDSFSIKTLLSQQVIEADRDVDMDRTSLTANDFPDAVGPYDSIDEAPIREAINLLEQRYETTTAEINVSSDESNGAEGFAFDWIVGAFYLDEETDSFVNNFMDIERTGLPLDTSIPDPFHRNHDIDFINQLKATRESKSVYGQGTFHLTAAMRLIAGFRYSEEEVDNLVCAFRCFSKAVNGIDFTPRNVVFSDDEITGRVAFESDIGEDSLLYFGISTGFKPGGGNNTPSDLIPEKFSPETVTSYDIGYKTRFLDGRVQLNTSVFHYNYENMHYMGNAPTPFAGGVANIPESEVTGAEFELTAVLTDNLHLDANLAWLDSEITKDAFVLDSREADDASINELIANGGSPFGPGRQDIIDARATAIQNIKGNELSKSPELSFNLRLTHTYDVGSANLVSFLSFTHVDEFYYRVFNNEERDLIESYDLVGLNFTYEPHNSDWFVALSISNLTDEDIVNSAFTDNFGASASSVEYMAPRLVQMRVGMDF